MFPAFPKNEDTFYKTTTLSQLKINNHFEMESSVLSFLLKLETFVFGLHDDPAFQI